MTTTKRACEPMIHAILELWQTIEFLMFYRSLDRFSDEFVPQHHTRNHVFNKHRKYTALVIVPRMTLIIRFLLHSKETGLLQEFDNDEMFFP